MIGLIGESCTGKSTIAEELSKRCEVTVVTGKDYLRLAKNEGIAKKLFVKQLTNVVISKEENIVFVISEKEHVDMLPQGSIRVLVTADLEEIKARFTVRMRGNLPAPVIKMLEAKHGIFDKEPHDLHIESGESTVEAIVDDIVKLIEER